MSTSKLQRKVSNQLSIHFGGHTIRENIRPYWCHGFNGERLELDFYIEELDIAIEVQGAQHYVYTPHFHGTYEGFQRQQDRDEAKMQRCKEMGITLLELSSETELLDVIRTIQHEALVLSGGNNEEENGQYINHGLDDKLYGITQIIARRLRRQKTRYSRGTLKFYRRIQEITERHGEQVVNNIRPDTLTQVIDIMKRLEEMMYILETLPVKQIKRNKKHSQRNRMTVSKKGCKRRTRARRELRIGLTDQPNKFCVWGGSQAYYVYVLPDEVVCTCDNFVIEATRYCSHIAKYDLVVLQGEGVFE